MFYTSYFAVGKMIPERIELIGICPGVPNYFKDFRGKKGLQYKPLKPKFYMWKTFTETRNEEEFKKAYEEEILGNLDPHQVAEELKALTDKEDICLMAFEKKNFSHRHLVADWFNKAGIPCEEYDPYDHMRPTDESLVRQEEKLGRKRYKLERLKRIAVEEGTVDTEEFKYKYDKRKKLLDSIDERLQFKKTIVDDPEITEEMRPPKLRKFHNGTPKKVLRKREEKRKREDVQAM